MNGINGIIRIVGSVFSCAVAAVGGICPIDGYNVFTYADSGYLPDVNLSVTGGDTNDPFYRLPQAGIPLSPRLSASVLLGAETGDPLLNTFSSPDAYANRDHRTFGGVEYNCKRLPLSIAARYRYIDTYTDRFDGHWRDYSAITGNRMRNSNMGVSYEKFAAAQWNGRRVQVEASVNPYGRWHATPYYFSPLFEEGFSAGRKLTLQFKRVKIVSMQEMVRSKWYYDHQTPVKFNDNYIKNDVSVYLGKRFSGLLSGTWATALKPAAHVDAGIARTDSVSNAGVVVTAFSNKKMSGDLYGALHITGNWHCSLMVAYDYRQKSRSYHFMQNDTVVSYRPTAYSRNSIFGAATWNASLHFPLNISGWFFHCDRIIRESVDESGDTVIIRQKTGGGSVRTFAGINGWWKMEGKRLCLSVRPALIVPFGEREDIGFFIGKMAEFEAAWRSGDSNPAQASVKLACNDRPSLTYLITRSGQGVYDRRTFDAPVNVALYMSCRIPFIFMPVHSFVNETAFSVSAGPLRFTEKRRYPFHPMGNDFGPEMYVGFEGAIR